MTKKDSEFMDYDEDDVLSKLYDKALHIAQPEPATFDEEVYDEELYDELYEEYGEEFFEEDYLENRIKFEESPFEQAEREKFESGTVLSQKEFTYQFQIKSLDSVTISNLLRKTDFYRFLIRNDKIERMLEKVYQKSVNEYLSYGNEQAIGTVAEDNVINGTYFRVVISTSHLVDSYQVEINFYINE